MTKVSVIIPVYQVRSYLERCLDSILLQSWTDYEVILVDDGSTDGSDVICDRYNKQYDRIRTIHKPNGGLSSARNAGIEIAQGEYLLFVDADDLLHRKALETEITVLERHDADIVICPLRKFERIEDINTNSSVEECPDGVLMSGMEAEKGFFNNQNANMYVSSCGKLFRRSLFDNVRFPEGRLFEDEYTTYKLYFKAGKVAVIDTPLYFYFINDSGITQNLTINKRFDEYDAQIERITFFREKGLEDLYRISLLEFLKTAQWDLKICQEGKQDFDRERGAAFQRQYSSALNQADQEKITSFTKDYDYYVLGYPNKKFYYRIKRKILIALGKM